jgi:AcrR family transcriptional regulator
MSQTTRDRLLQEAEALFAERGFYGVSINAVARELSLTKQGLLHYFPTKEKLYAEVLKRAAAMLMADLERRIGDLEDPVEQLMAAFDEVPISDPGMVRVARLLTRELLDNPARAQRSQSWFLRPYLDRLESIVRDAQAAGFLGQVDPAAFVYHLIGADQYFVISQATLRQLRPRAEFEAHLANHDRETRRAILAALVTGRHEETSGNEH